MTTTDKVASATIATRHLQALGEQLEKRGLHVRVATTPNGLPQLIVVSTTAPTLSEVILAAQRDGVWWYWWSWAERISTADDLATAVTLIHHALTPTRRRNG